MTNITMRDIYYRLKRFISLKFIADYLEVSPAIFSNKCLKGQFLTQQEAEQFCRGLEFLIEELNQILSIVKNLPTKK